MNPTGAHPRLWRFSPLKSSLCGLALAAILMGTCSTAFAEKADLTKPRVERVRDVDGSIWEVQIVPRPLYHPRPICPPPADPTPAASPLVPPVPGQKEDADKTEEETAGTEEAVLKHDAPANAEKSDTVLISLQDDKAEEKAEEKDEPSEPPFGVDIVPRFTIQPHHPEEPCIQAVPNPCHPNAADYLHVYTSIPFIRSEYIANPSYRHEATMEFLFGKLRPTVVNKNPPRPRPHETLFPFENDVITPYSYYSMGAGAGYGRGPLPFGAPGAYGVNYNFYYPMPTVYRSY